MAKTVAEERYLAGVGCIEFVGASDVEVVAGDPHLRGFRHPVPTLADTPLNKIA